MKYTVSGSTLQYKVGLTLSFLSLISRGVYGNQKGNTSIQYTYYCTASHSMRKSLSCSTSTVSHDSNLKSVLLILIIIGIFVQVPVGQVRFGILVERVGLVHESHHQVPIWQAPHRVEQNEVCDRDDGREHVRIRRQVRHERREPLGQARRNERKQKEIQHRVSEG